MFALVSETDQAGIFEFHSLDRSEDIIAFAFVNERNMNPLTSPRWIRRNVIVLVIALWTTKHSFGFLASNDAPTIEYTVFNVSNDEFNDGDQAPAKESVTLTTQNNGSNDASNGDLIFQKTSLVDSDSSTPSQTPSKATRSKRPTRRPAVYSTTNFLIANITVQPTPSPGQVNIPSPTANPVVNEIERLEKPAKEPSTGPTGSPSVSPVDQPESPPTNAPVSTAPSGIILPMNYPENVDAIYGSTPPTHMPTITVQKGEIPCAMVLYYSELLDDDPIETWERVTKRMIQDQLVSLTSVDRKLAKLHLRLESQKVLSHSRANPLSEREPVRNLRSSSPLHIEFTTFIEFSSSNNFRNEDNWNVAQIIATAFQTSKKQQDYITSLKDESGRLNFKGDFKDVEDITLVVDGLLTTESYVDKPHGPGVSRDKKPSYINLVATVSACLGLLLCGVLVRMCLSKHKAEGEKETSNNDQGNQDISHTDIVESKSNATVYQPSNLPLSIIGSKDVENDGISTLGDPSFADMVNTVIEKDNTVAESMVSSQHKRFVHGIPRSAASVSRAEASPDYLSSKGLAVMDDESFEKGYWNPPREESREEGADLRQVTIVAPPGKLGIVLTNPYGDLPVVHGIREASALKGSVRVDDCLLSVDGEDCRGMSALRVSRLLNSRSQNSERTLVLVRSPSIISPHLGNR